MNTAATSLTCEKTIKLDDWISLENFSYILSFPSHLHLCPNVVERLNKTRRFIDHCLQEKISVYGLTTGFADLRSKEISPEKAACLSKNLIHSHDAGIGSPLPMDVTLGAMYLRVHSLSKGHSGFSLESLTPLVRMIEERIIPEIPKTGSLGASGDLAYFARLGRAMMGEEVLVHYKGEKMSAKQALTMARISPFQPKAKEGLALTNGTSFMASMMAIGYSRLKNWLENLFSLQGLFLCATHASKGAFCEMIQDVRHQEGQSCVASLLRPFFENNATSEIQNDYSIRCLPQILGPKLALIWEQEAKLENELNAITDNPLLFCGKEISKDVQEKDLLFFEKEHWAVISGGNFHGENLATTGDLLRMVNAKIALTLERQLTYLMNPARNKHRFPIYLIPKETLAGIHSGHMITQYTANALTHKIATLALPTTHMNITSANEAEDIVSYGATSAEKFLEQMDLLEELLSIYLVVTAQGYSIGRESLTIKNAKAEALFETIQEHLELPLKEDAPFEKRYEIASLLLKSGLLQTKIHNPLRK